MSEGFWAAMSGIIFGGLIVGAAVGSCVIRATCSADAICHAVNDSTRVDCTNVDRPIAIAATVGKSAMVKCVPIPAKEASDGL